MKRVVDELRRIAGELFESERVAADNKIYAMSGNPNASVRDLVEEDSQSKNGSFRIHNKCDFSSQDDKDYCYELKYRGKVVRAKNDDKENAQSLREYLTDDEIEKIGSWDLFSKRVELLLSDRKIAAVFYNRDDYGKASSSNITGMKLVQSKKDYEDDEYPDPMSVGLSDKTHSWLKKFMSHAGARKNVPKAIRSELGQFNLGRPLKLYRGMGWHKEELRRLSSFYSYPFERGDQMKIKHPRPSSWTSNKLIAENFAEDTGPYWVVLEAKIDPKDVVVDTRLLPDEILDSLYFARQREVIVDRGSYSVKIVKIGLEKDGTLDVGWEETEDDPLIWGMIEDAYKKLASRIGWTLGTPREHYNGKPGMMDTRKFNEKKSRVIFSYFYDGKYWLRIDQWEKSTSRVREKKEFSSPRELIKAIESLF